MKEFPGYGTSGRLLVNSAQGWSREKVEATFTEPEADCDLRGSVDFAWAHEKRDFRLIGELAIRDRLCRAIEEARGKPHRSANSPASDRC